jgi:putative oxidoreductase
MSAFNLTFSFKSPLIDYLALFTRIIFLSTLFLFFIKSGITKFDGFFTLSLGAYIQIFPKIFEALSYDPNQLGVLYKFIAFVGAISELTLPILIVFGFMTRICAFSMLIFIVAMSVVDVFGHNIMPGIMFDGDPSGIIVDQRLLWGLLFINLIVLGGGKLSVDMWLAARFKYGLLRFIK